MKIIITCAVLLMFIVFGCYYDSKEYLYPILSSSCDTTNVTFSGSVKPALQSYCVSCHSNSNAASFGSNIKLEDYADVKIQATNGKLLGSLMHQSGYSAMPKGGGSLDACKLTTIKKWINTGSLNN